MAEPRPTDTELLAELAPLAGVIAGKLGTVPVRLGPGGTDDLITELTLAIAVYVGRHVLPAEALDVRKPPRPTQHVWQMETRWDDGRWQTYGAPWDERGRAHEDFTEVVATAASATGAYARSREYRLVRATTTYAVEAEHQPAVVSAVPPQPEETQPAPAHIGGGANAEDCPACHGTNPPYPFICPGKEA